MHVTKLLQPVMALSPFVQEPESLRGGILQQLERLTYLLAFTLAIFMVLNYAIYFLALATKKPVPRDIFDMARLKGLRTALLSFAVLLTPPIMLTFLPIEAPNTQWYVETYISNIVIGVILWFILEAFYQRRKK